MWRNIKDRILYEKGELVRIKLNTHEIGFISFLKNSNNWNKVVSYYAHYMDNNNRCKIVHFDNLDYTDIAYFGGWWVKLRDFNGKYFNRREEYLVNVENSFMNKRQKREIKLKYLLL